MSGSIGLNTVGAGLLTATDIVIGREEHREAMHIQEAHSCECPVAFAAKTNWLE